MPDDTDDPDDKYAHTETKTTSASTRYPYTNDLLAGVLVLFAVGASSAFIYQGQDVPLWLAGVDALAIITAVVWAFGKGAAKLAGKLVGGDGNA